MANQGTRTAELMERALRHALQRDHGYMEFCDGCKESRELLTLAVNAHAELVKALEAARDHVAELREAWQRGVIRDVVGI